jgi:zinc protease
VERIRRQILVHLARDEGRPEEVASLAWWAAAYPGHPYGRPVRGSIETVKRIAIDDLKDFRRRVFAREGMKVAIVGDIDAADAGRMLDKVFGGLPAEGELAAGPDVKPKALGQRIVHEMNVPQAAVVFGGAGIARNDADFTAAYIINHILGGGSFSSRLYTEVREKQGLAYGIHGSLVWLRHSAIVIGSTATRADRTADALAIIEREIKRMREEGPTAEELAKAKSYLKGSYALNLDTSGKIAAQLVQIQIDDLGIDYFERRGRLIDAVTVAEAKRVARRLFEGGTLVTVAGRPSGLTGKTPGG